MNRTITAAATIVASAALVAASAAPSHAATTNDPAVVGTWAAVRVSVPTIPAVPSATMRIDAAGTLNGWDGCNRFWGTVSSNAATHTMTIHLVGQTRMLCYLPTWFNPRALEGTHRYTVNATTLTLSTTAWPATTLTFRRA